MHGNVEEKDTCSGLEHEHGEWTECSIQTVLSSPSPVPLAVRTPGGTFWSLPTLAPVWLGEARPLMPRLPNTSLSLFTSSEAARRQARGHVSKQQGYTIK